MPTLCCYRKRKLPLKWSDLRRRTTRRRSGSGSGVAAAPLWCHDAGFGASGVLLPAARREPILRLAKSALVTVYPLPDTRLLMVVNIHAVNFSLGVDVYSKQLLPIGDQIAHHSGPVIMAGDFNARVVHV